jgi:hypothetical protein
MKRHLGWMRVAATAAIVAGSNLSESIAQHAAYRPMSQPPSATQPFVRQQPPISTAQSAYSPYRPQAPQHATPVVGQYPTTGYPQVTVGYGTGATGYPQTTAAYPSMPVYPSAPVGYPQTRYPRVAQLTDEAMPSPQGEALPSPGPSIEPAPMNGGVTTNGTNGAITHNGAGGPVPADQAYSQNGCANGTGNYGHGDVYHGGGYADYGVSGYFNDGDCNTQWFGGVYWLFMNRDDGEYRRLTAQFDTPAGGYPYYPTADVTVLSTENVDHDYRSGVEVRFGSTLSAGGWGDDDCHSGYGYGHSYGHGTGCDSQCATNDYAWELAYWYLDDDINTAQVVDAIPNDTYRMYGMKNFAGLEYNGEPVNLWYDYQVPVEDPAGTPPWGSGTLVRVLAQRVRSNFKAQNLELNFLRLPLCGGSMCGYGSCDSGGCDSYGAADCEPACGSPFSVITLCGIRYMRIDDDFEYATMWAIDDGSGTLTPPAYTPWDGAGELYYDINVDNHLTGFQLGANMSYCVSCKCHLFWNSTFGLYNNHINSYQRVYGDQGPATWVGSGENAAIRSRKDDVAFVGELLLGGSYDITCNWRGVLAYRAVAISGVALSTDQIPEDFSNQWQVALVDSNGSLIIHGVQAGFECRY